MESERIYVELYKNSLVNLLKYLVNIYCKFTKYIL